MSASLLRTLSLVMAVFFTYAAIVQWNDPDWFTWMFLYAAAAYFSLQYGVSTLSVYISTIFGAVALLRLALIYVLEVKTIDSIAYMVESELGRELGGCLVVAFWMAVMASTSSASQKEPSFLGSVALVLPVFSIVFVSLGLPLWLKWRNVSVEEHCTGTLPTLNDLFPSSKAEL
ncbi:hypothetical protein MHU86_5213 [Fragilaria crotonensis]|nr:hypothetical protein MHU86_5213 [Fragilaria crotonensis]